LQNQISVERKLYFCCKKIKVFCTAFERTGNCRGFWWESQKETDHLEDQGIDGRMGSE
jgi:hypothetical protein